MEQSNLNEPAAANLDACNTVGELAQFEGWTPDRYAIALSENIRNSAVPLDMQRERLQALAQVGAGADRASAEELARHYNVLEALFHRFARQAHDTVSDHPGRVDAASKYLDMALKAQRAAMATMSALKVLRENQPQPPTTPAPPDTPAPEIVPMAKAT